MLLQKMTWPEVKEELEKGTVVIVPVGSTEQHGHHLPIDTDVAITYYIDLVEKPPVIIRTHWDKNSKSGVIGDPTLATREKGEKLVNAAIEGLVEFLRLFKNEITY